MKSLIILGLLVVFGLGYVAIKEVEYRKNVERCIENGGQKVYYSSNSTGCIEKKEF